jgi:hypothetical protein
MKRIRRILLSALVFLACLWPQLLRADALDQWTQRNSGTSYPLGAITFADEQFVAVGSSSAVLTSTDAMNWSPQSGGSGDVWLNSIAYGQGRFVAVGSGLDGHIVNFMTSSNGLVWGQGTGWLGEFYGITYGDGEFVVVSEGGIEWSADGVDWDLYLNAAHPSTNFLRSITYANGQFVAVGDSGTIVTSVDATNWVQAESGMAIGLNGIASGRGVLVAVGGDPLYQLAEGVVILTSTNGVDWVQRQRGTTNGLSAVAYGSGQFVAVGAFGTILSSADGINWIERQSGTQDDLRGVTYGNGHFVAVGENGTILESGKIFTLALTPSARTGLLTLALSGPTGLAYTVQSSTDLVSWQTLTNITSIQPTSVILDALAATGKRVFYRATSQ